MALLRLTQDALLPWLSEYSPSLARVALVPDQGTGPPILLCPDFLLAASPLIRSLLPQGFLPCPCQPLHILLPDVSREDLLTALQVVTRGSSTAITGVVVTNEKLWSVNKILKTLGVQINVAFDLHNHGACPIEIDIEDESTTLPPSQAEEVVNLVSETLEGTGAQKLPFPGTDKQFLKVLGSMKQSSELGAECMVQLQEAEKLGNSLQLLNPCEGDGSTEDLVTEVADESIEDILEDSDDHETAENASLMCPLCLETFPMSEELLGHQEKCKQRNIVQGPQEGDNEQETDVNIGNSLTVTCCVNCNVTLSFEELLLHQVECPVVKGQVDVEEAAAVSRPHLCPVCGKGSKTKPHMLAHMESHRGSSHIHQCQECNKTYKYSRHAKIHMKKEHNQDMFFCITHNCSSSFSDRDSLVKHMKEIHSVGKTKCNVCLTAFKYPHYMTQHMQKAHNMNVFVCSFPGCGAILESKELITQHRKDLHAKVNQGVIKVAKETEQKEKPIKQADSLVGEKYKCDVCNKEFSTAANACTHKVGFHSTKAMECDLCNASFKWKQSLQLHMKKVHKSVRFICRSMGCYAMFENKDTQRQHKREMHHAGGTMTLKSTPSKRKVDGLGSKKYKCYECKKVFKSYQYLRYHKKRYHAKLHRCKYNCGEKFKELLEMKEHSAMCGLISE